MCTYTPIHPYTHTHIHVRVNMSDIHTNIHVYILTQKHVHTCTHSCTQIPIDVGVYIHTHPCTFYTCMNVLVPHTNSCTRTIIIFRTESTDKNYFIIISLVFCPRHSTSL